MQHMFSFKAMHEDVKAELSRQFTKNKVCEILLGCLNIFKSRFKKEYFEMKRKKKISEVHKVLEEKKMILQMTKDVQAYLRGEKPSTTQSFKFFSSKSFANRRVESGTGKRRAEAEEDAAKSDGRADEIPGHLGCEW